MTREEWAEEIVMCMKSNGTFKESYMTAVDTLADILERRDLAMAEWRKGKCKLLVTKKSDRGATNKVKNPLLLIAQDCEKDALTYLAHLGLTPSGLKKAVAEDRETKQSPLAEILSGGHGSKRA